MLQKDRYIKKIQRNFEEISKLNKFSTTEESKLISDVTELIGFLVNRWNEKIAQLTERMIKFGEKKGFSMAAQKYRLNQIRQHYISPDQQKKYAS